MEGLIVCSSDSDDALIVESERYGIETRQFDVAGDFNFVDYVKKLSSLLRDNDVDLLHTHGYKADILGYFSARYCGIKVLSTPHGWNSGAGAKVAIYEVANKFVLSAFDRVVPLSDELKRSLWMVPNRKLQLIHNFVDLDLLPEPAVGDPFLITFIGQLIERKRVQDLIRAVALTGDERMRVQVIGDGPMQKVLESLAGELNVIDQFQFLGYRADRLELQNRSAIAVLPSTLEGIPRTLMEAMGMGRAVVGTDIPGTSDLVTNGETGILVSTRNPERLADALVKLINEPDEIRRLAANGRQLIRERYSASSAAESYQRLYLDLSEAG